MSIDAMKQALEFIDSVKVHPSQIATRDALHDALRLAIEQAERQEPVAWVRDTENPCYGYTTIAPPQRQPLTDEEMWREYQALWPFHPQEEPRLAADIVTFARAIERAHGIGGGE